VLAQKLAAVGADERSQHKPDDDHVIELGGDLPRIVTKW